MELLIDFARMPGPLQIQSIALRIDDRSRSEAIRTAVSFAHDSITTVPIERVLIANEPYDSDPEPVNVDEVAAACEVHEDEELCSCDEFEHDAPGG